MDSGFTEPKQVKDEKKKTTESAFKTDTNLPGRITKTIGRGEDARNSFVYLTLRWAFWIGIVLTTLVVINNWFFDVDYKVPDIMTDISTTWEIVVPLITLALGYAFGKSKD